MNKENNIDKMNMILRTEESFDSAHYLKDYNGKCSRMHGHQWRIIILVKGMVKQINKVGILWDFSNLKKIVEQYDHYIINDKMKCNPTAENIAIKTYYELKEKNKNLKYKIRVYESKKSFAEFGDVI